MLTERNNNPLDILPQEGMKVLNVEGRSQFQKLISHMFYKKSKILHKKTRGQTKETKNDTINISSVIFSLPYSYFPLIIFNMNYLAQMLRDCSKSRTTTFSEISFTITQEVEKKIKNKNFNLRRKMKQRLTDMHKNVNFEDKKQQNNTLGKKPVVNQKPDKEAIPYIEAYTIQNNYYIDSASLPFNSAAFDQREAETSVNLYLLMRKKKAIFKIEEVRRKLRSKQNLRRFSLKECDCCQRVGKHRCQHKYCEANCQKRKKNERMIESAQDQDYNGQYPCIQNIPNNEELVYMKNQDKKCEQKDGPKQIVKEQQEIQLSQVQKEQFLKKVEKQKAEESTEEKKLKEEEKQAKEEQQGQKDEENNHLNSSFSSSERQQDISPEIMINQQSGQSENRSQYAIGIKQQQDNKEKE